MFCNLFSLCFCVQNNRLYKVIEYCDTLHGLCSVLGLDFLSTATEVHPSLDESEQAKSISNDTIERLAMTIRALQEEKKKRMQKVRTDLLSCLTSLEAF